MRKKKYRILNTELSIAADRARTEYFTLRDNTRAKSKLIEQILLYDRVYLFTSNFLIIPLLVEWAGMDGLLRLLRNNRIGFTRHKGYLGYDGEHKGIEHFILLRPRFTGNFNQDWLKIADTADIRTSVETILIKVLSNHKDRVLAELESLVVKNAKDVDDPKIGQKIHNETEADFLDEEIRKKLLIKAKDIESACDIPSNQMKIGFDEAVFDPEKSREIDKALAIGLTNFDFIIAKAIGEVDIHTDNISQLILEAKLKRSLKHKLIDNGLQTLLHFRKTPDFRTLVERNLLNFNNIFELLGSQDHMRFVHWLHNIVELRSGDDILCDYIDKLENLYNKHNLSIKTIRFLVTAGLGLFLDPLLGVGAAAIDSFIVDKLLKGWHPKLFLDKFRSTIGE